MSQQNQPELPVKVYAEAVVRSASGESLLDSRYPVTSENVHRFYAHGDRLQIAAQRLREAGFDVLDIGKISITIAAFPEVYERSLQTSLEAVERPVIKELGKTDIATFINAVDSKPFGEIDVSQTEWQELLDGVAINEPVYYFDAGLPSAVPPITSDEYLSIPEGVVEGLNATLAHQQGITGQGVKVAMVDTGWYPHPFFTQRNYKVDVVLAPGSTDRWRDDTGHGTGESANLLAIAPNVSLTIVKADIALSGKHRNIDSVSAFRTAVNLQPDIICCSWGADQRRRRLSPQNLVFAALVADAVRQGITVIFAAGNGHYGFPAQHPDVIAAGGVYLYCNGSLKGTLEASNYASSFVSPVYPGRSVPDVCGLVGNLPYGSYIMLPVPPGSKVDRQLASVQDGTEPTDGWAAFSGTSAAAPQLAGICALMKQVNPALSPAQVKQVLQQTARDVVDGFSNPSSSGAPARAGPDSATGYGLANAHASIQTVKALTKENCCSECAASTQAFSTNYLTPQVGHRMYSRFPKLQAKLDEIEVKLNEFLRREFIDLEIPLIEEVELHVTEANFVLPSPQTKAVSSLIKILTDLPKSKSEKLAEIDKKHVLAAESLLRMNRGQELAMEVLVIAIASTKKKVPELAAKALGELGIQSSSGYFDDSCNADMCCRVGENIWVKSGNRYSDANCTLLISNSG